MDRGLTDLDALLLTVRDWQTKNYLAEAVLAYRTGAFRLALVGTWTAVAYDMITKIRELSSEGDAGAIAFISEFDRNVTADNISKLLELEKNLIDAVVNKFAFVGVREAENLRRLYSDRGLCAHPAFSTTNETIPAFP